MFRNYEMRRLDLCSPNPTLYYSIGSILCTNLTLCDNCMFACVLYVCLCVVCLLWVIGSVLGSETTRCGDWICALQTRRCIIRLGLYSVKILHYAAIVCLLVCCMFACVLYVCLCVVWLLCGDWVCTRFRNYEMRRLGLCSPNPTLYYSIGSLLCKNPTLCSNCMFACVLYVCLCVVWLLCGDWVCTRFRNYEMRRLGLCSPDPTLYYSIGSYSVKILHYAVIVCLLVCCMFACVLYVCNVVIGSVLGSETTRCGDWICALQTRRCIIRLGHTL